MLYFCFSLFFLNSTTFALNTRFASLNSLPLIMSTSGLLLLMKRHKPNLMAVRLDFEYGYLSFLLASTFNKSFKTGIGNEAKSVD